MGDVFSQIMVSCLYMSKEYQQRKENAIPVPLITRGFLILVPRGSFSFVHVHVQVKIAEDCFR